MKLEFMQIQRGAFHPFCAGGMLRAVAARGFAYVAAPEVFGK
jgi:hypothetical protein